MDSRTFSQLREFAPVVLGLLVWIVSSVAVGFDGSGISTSRNPVEAERPFVAPRYRLIYKFRVGQEVYYDSIHSTRISTRKDESIETTQNESKTLKHFRVMSINDKGEAVLDSYLDCVQMSYQFNNHPKVEFNSESTGPVPRGFSDIKLSVGRPLSRLTVDRSGRMISILSLAERDERQSKAASTDKTRNFLFELPEEAIEVGHEWVERIPAKVTVSKYLTNTVVLLRKFKLESVENNLATISVKTDLLTPLDDPKLLAQLIQRTPRGSFVFDIDQGLIASRTFITDKSEIGVVGPNSMMRATGQLTETLARRPVIAEKVSLHNSPKSSTTE